LVHGFVWGMTSGRTKISPKSWRGLGHVTIQLLACDRTYLQNYLNLVSGFILPLLFYYKVLLTIVYGRLSLRQRGFLLRLGCCRAQPHLARFVYGDLDYFSCN